MIKQLITKETLTNIFVLVVTSLGLLFVSKRLYDYWVEQIKREVSKPLIVRKDDDDEYCGYYKGEKN